MISEKMSYNPYKLPPSHPPVAPSYSLDLTSDLTINPPRKEHKTWSNSGRGDRDKTPSADTLRQIVATAAAATPAIQSR